MMRPIAAILLLMTTLLGCSSPTEDPSQDLSSQPGQASSPTENPNQDLSNQTAESSSSTQSAESVFSGLTFFQETGRRLIFSGSAVKYEYVFGADEYFKPNHDENGDPSKYLISGDIMFLHDRVPVPEQITEKNYIRFSRISVLRELGIASESFVEPGDDPYRASASYVKRSDLETKLKYHPGDVFVITGTYETSGQKARLTFKGPKSQLVLLPWLFTEKEPEVTVSFDVTLGEFKDLSGDMGDFKLDREN